MLIRLLHHRSHYKRFTSRLHIDMTRRFREAVGWLAAILALHTLAMVVLEGLPLGDAAWLTLTTVTTVGYGDYSAATTAGRVATVVLLYLGGITLLAEIASQYIELRIQRKSQMIAGQWNWDMDNHLLIINSPANQPEAYFNRLLIQLRETDEFRDAPVQIATDAFPDGLPSSLRDLGAVHRHLDATDPDALALATPERARAVIVLARDEYSRVSDSINLDVLLQLGSICGDHLPMTLLECVAADNNARAKRLGAHATIRPVRAYPEILVRALVAPGSEAVLENLFTHADDHARRYEVSVRGVVWADAVCALMQAGLGTLISYVTPDGYVETHPAHDHRFDASAVIVLVRAEAVPTSTQIDSCLTALSQPKE